MIKGITFISAVASAGAPGAEFDRLTSLFSALGFEQGKGWQDAEGRGAAFLAPIGNLEFVTGRLPAPPVVGLLTGIRSAFPPVQTEREGQATQAAALAAVFSSAALTGQPEF